MPLYVTHCDKNYASRAMALIDSMRRHGCADPIYAICHDQDALEQLNGIGDGRLMPIHLNELEDAYPELLLAKSNRSHLEYLFCLTPFLLLFANTKTPNELLIYLDSDLYFFDHPSKAIPISTEPYDVAIASHNFPIKLQHLEVYGKYNVGWLAFAQTDNSLKLLRWWADKCAESTSIEKDRSIFADQKYLDSFDSMEASVYSISSIPRNGAPWNCFDVESGINEELTVSGTPLIFFHFSGLRRKRLITVLGYSGYGIRPSNRLKKFVFRPYIVSLSKFEERAGQGRHIDTQKFFLKDWIRILFFLDYVL
jgi:hypothetical protein